MSEMDDTMAAELNESSLAAIYPITPGLETFVSMEEEVEDRSSKSKAHGRGNGRRLTLQTAPPLRRVLEAVLFATDRPVTVEQLLCAVPGEDPELLESELRGMARDYEERGHGFRLHESGGGYWLRTDPELHEYVNQFLVGKKRTRLSRAAMESLAIVAYRQPITRGEVEEIRGVDSGHVFHTLMERNLITVRGRSQALGRPLLYGTTEEFLHYFGIRSLADLPTPEELQALLGEDPLMDPEIRQSLAAHGLFDEGAGPPEEDSAAVADGADRVDGDDRVDGADPVDGDDRVDGAVGVEVADVAEAAEVTAVIDGSLQGDGPLPAVC
jgi:segregation and condensation protein B